jgi:ribosomal protein S12 methylthiotransferase accessory factor YcaO
VHKDIWIHLPYEPLKPRSVHNPNPLYSRSGEAFHVNRGEALRSAFCELLEREALYRTANGRAQLFDITDYARELSRDADAAFDYWSSSGYDLRLSLVDTPWKVCVVLATCQQASRQFPMLFKGSGADFRPNHAIIQAVSELGRNAFMGPAVRCRTQTSVEAFVKDRTNNWFERDNLALELPEHGERLAEQVRSAPQLEHQTWQIVCNKYTPQVSFAALRASGHSVWFVPLADEFLGIPGVACKFIAPDLPQEPHFANLG